MKNLQKKNRLEVLSARYEKLISLNQKYHYTEMILTSKGLMPNPKAKKYIKLLKRIYEERVGLYVFNRKNNKVYSGNLETTKKAVVSLTREHLFNLTSPAL